MRARATQRDIVHVWERGSAKYSTMCGTECSVRGSYSWQKTLRALHAAVIRPRLAVASTMMITAVKVILVGVAGAEHGAGRRHDDALIDD